MKVKSLDKLHGSGFMLQVALNCNRAEVAHKAADLLMQVRLVLTHLHYWTSRPRSRRFVRRELLVGVAVAMFRCARRCTFVVRKAQSWRRRECLNSQRE